jgi:hypothetical protein
MQAILSLSYLILPHGSILNGEKVPARLWRDQYTFEGEGVRKKLSVDYPKLDK